MNPQLAGFGFAFLAYVIFTTQDAISKHLGHFYPPFYIAMIRYWVFAVFVLALAASRPGGIRQVSVTAMPWLQLLRSLLLVAQIITGILSFAHVGLAHSQAIFASAPLLIAALSVPVLGEQVGWRRWLAILVGMSGVLIMIRPEAGSINPALVWPMINVVLSSLYALITRKVNRTDTPTTSLFYTGIFGFVVMTLIGPFYWTVPTPVDMAWLGLLCVTGIASHFCLIIAYSYLQAVQVQPLAYFQLVLGSILGVVVFGEIIEWHVVVGAVIVTAAGLFTIWREALTSRRDNRKHDALPPAALP